MLKGWSTESSVELTSLAIQIFGGMGFVEETGISQYMRDARITPIYEGTTAIQAADLAGRKIARDGGKVLAALVADMRADAASLVDSGNATLAAIGTRIGNGLADLEAATAALLEKMGTQPAAGLVVAEPFLKLFASVAGGWLMGKAAHKAVAAIAAGSDDPFYKGKIASAKFYADHILTRSSGLLATVQADNSLLLEMADEGF